MYTHFSQQFIRSLDCRWKLRKRVEKINQIEYATWLANGCAYAGQYKRGHNKVLIDTNRKINYPWKQCMAQKCVRVSVDHITWRMTSIYKIQNGFLFCVNLKCSDASPTTALYVEFSFTHYLYGCALALRRSQRNENIIRWASCVQLFEQSIWSLYAVKVILM